MKILTKYYFIAAILASLTFQSFQCASPEFTGAKMAHQQKDYAKAAAGLEKELVKNPNNSEAWYLLADCQFRLGDMKKAAQSSLEASKKASTEQQKNKVSDQLFFFWAEMYNKGTNLYNDFLATDKSGDITQLVDLLEVASSLKPENAEPLSLLGNTYELKGDSTKATETYERYFNQVKPNIEFMVSKNITIGMSRENALATLGKPAYTKAFIDNNGDSLMIDKIIVNGSEVFLSSSKRPEGKAVVDGLRTNLPSNWLLQERERFYAINIRPLTNFAFLHYAAKKLDKALAVIDLCLAINPADDELSSLKVQIYEEQGKSDEVLKSLELAAQKNPNSKIALEQYARFLARQKEYEKAITYYEKALAVDPNYEMAVFNIGACYVNKAVEIIDEENKKIDANSKYKPDENRYFPLLNKAADFFNQYRSNPVNKENLGVLQQLSDIYIITRQNDKFKKVVVDLESIEVANLTNASYYEYMGKVYAKQGQKEKADKAFQMADTLKKK